MTYIYINDAHVCVWWRWNGSFQLGKGMADYRVAAVSCKHTICYVEWLNWRTSCFINSRQCLLLVVFGYINNKPSCLFQKYWLFIWFMFFVLWIGVGSLLCHILQSGFSTVRHSQVFRNRWMSQVLSLYILTFDYLCFNANAGSLQSKTWMY